MLKEHKNTIRKVLLKQSNQIEAFIFRQTCSMSSIPSLRILAKEGNILTIEVEDYSLKLVDFLKVLQNQLMSLSFLSKTLSTCRFLSQKFGCFALTSNLLKLDHQERLKIWIHEDPLAFQPQLPINSGRSGQKVMIKSILAIFKPYLKCYQFLIKRGKFSQLQQVILQLTLEQRRKNSTMGIKKVFSTTFLNQLPNLQGTISQEQFLSAGTIKKYNSIQQNRQNKNNFDIPRKSVELCDPYQRLLIGKKTYSTQNLKIDNDNGKRIMFRYNSNYLNQQKKLNQKNSIQQNQLIYNNFEQPLIDLIKQKIDKKLLPVNEQKFSGIRSRNSSRVFIGVKQDQLTLNSIKERQSNLDSSKISYENQLLQNLLNEIQSPDSKVSMKSRATNDTLQDELNSLFPQYQLDEEIFNQLKKEFAQIL